jgi:Opacity family porin protein.
MKKAIAGLALALVCAFATQAHAQESIQSDNALAYVSLDLDTKGGWVAKVKGGYQWKLFKDAGLEIKNNAGTTLMSREKDFTKSGGAASVSLGYNFSPKIPLTLGLEFGLGPQGKLDTTMRNAAGQSFFSRQRVRIYTLDLSADYEFFKCARWTPFVGVTGGVAFVSNKARATYDNGVDTFRGHYGKKSSVNFMGGGRAGVRYKMNERVTLSLYGSYNYLGHVNGKRFELSDGGGNTVQARTQKITAHSLDVKAGLKITF